MSIAPVAKSPVPAPSHGITCSMFAGADVENVLPEKQLPSAAVAQHHRRGRRGPDRPTTLSVTRLPTVDWWGSTSSPTLGASTIPTLSLSTTRFFVIDVPVPPAMTMPTPKAASKALVVRARGVASHRCRRPCCRRSSPAPWGESSSPSKLFGTMPVRLRDQSSSPGRGRPTSSTPSSRAGCTPTTTSVITAWQGLHCPM